jgi:hypothetical protein
MRTMQTNEPLPWASSELERMRKVAIAVKFTVLTTLLLGCDAVSVGK